MDFWSVRIILSRVPVGCTRKREVTAAPQRLRFRPQHRGMALHSVRPPHISRLAQRRGPSHPHQRRLALRQHHRGRVRPSGHYLGHVTGGTGPHCGGWVSRSGQFQGDHLSSHLREHHPHAGLSRTVESVSPSAFGWHRAGWFVWLGSPVTHAATGNVVRNANPEISAHQKQWFFKGGKYTKPMTFDGFWNVSYCFEKLSARGVYFGKYGIGIQY